MAVVGMPFLAIVTSENKSPMELPHAKTVKPRKVGERPSEIPIALRQAMSSLQIPASVNSTYSLYVEMLETRYLRE